MAAATNYDQSNNTVLQWAMFVGEGWAKLSFDRKSGQLTHTYNSDTGYYEVALNNLVFKGKSAAKTMTLGKLVSCCNLVVQVHDNNGIARVFGKEFYAGSWGSPVARGRVSRHLDTTGSFGSEDDRSRDEVDFTAIHACPPPYSTVSVADMELLLSSSEVGGNILGLAVNKVLGLSLTKVLGK